MKILEGAIPDGNAWRVLVLLSPDENLGRAFALGSALAHSNKGELITAVFVTDESEATLLACQNIITHAKENCLKDQTPHPLVIYSDNLDNSLKELIKEASIDLLLVHADSTTRHDYSRLNCGVVALRGDRVEIEGEEAASGKQQLTRILVPTAGGPNTAHALTFLLPLTPEIEVNVLYVVIGEQSDGGQKLGEDRLRQLLEYVDAGDRIKSKVAFSESVTDAIVNEVSAGYDLVIIGASRESSIDKVLFGDIPGVVVRTSRRPVAVVRQPQQLTGDLGWRIRKWMPRLNLSERTAAYVRIRRNARPDIDYYMLISLSAMIASLGLIANSAAVVIGAMLVAPLMSPIIGSGLAIVLGDARFLRRSIGAVMQGAVLAILVGMIAGLLALNQPLSHEVLSRTQPSLLDLAIALFSGLAAAYALCRSDAAGALPGVAIAAALVPPLSTVGITFTVSLVNTFQNSGVAQVIGINQFRMPLGALLLFTTNFVAISFAAALMFLILGYRPAAARKERKRMQTRAFRAAIVLLVLVSFLLVFTTYELAQEQQKLSRIREVTEQHVVDVAGGKLTDMEIVTFEDGFLELDLIVRSSTAIPYFVVKDLQEGIGGVLSGEGIIDEIALTMTVIRVTELDPLVAPTATPTSTASPTMTMTPSMTPLPSSTSTQTPIPTSTFEPTATMIMRATATLTPSATSTLTPTMTFTPTPTPVTAVVTYPYGLNLRAEPSTEGAIVDILPENSVIIILKEQIEADGILWQQIEADGQIGWVSDEFLLQN